MKSILNKYQPWIKEYLEPRYPELVPLLKAALLSYDRVSKKRQLAVGDIQPIIDIVRSPCGPLCEIGALLLGDLAVEHSVAYKAVEMMTTDSKAEIRTNAIIALGGQAPRELSINIVRRSLVDKNSHVRKMAADYALRLYLSEALPNLERALSVETNSRTCRVIEFSLEKLKEGN